MYSCIFIVIVCIEIRVYSKYIVQKYLNVGTLQKIWKNYMNPDRVSYGLWDTNHATIKTANANLYSFMITKANILQSHSVLKLGNILKDKKKKENKKEKKWDRIVSIESDITNLQNKLNNDGILVCSNIVLKDNTYSSFYVDTIFDFLGIPKLSYSEWKSKLESTFTLVELHDITENTLNPYYHYLFNTFITEKQLPQWVADILIYYFNNIPFHYMVAVCKK